MSWLHIAILGLSEALANGAEVEYVARVWAPPAEFPPALRDVASRLPSNTDARDADLVTYTHEANHFLCRGKPGYHGVYVGNGIRIFIPTPPLTTERVFAAVPITKRGTIYNTYLAQGRTEYWSTQPLMILDEWQAYIAGSQARAQMNMRQRGETTVHCATMAGYAEVLYRLAKECREYPITDLKNFCNYQLDRCREIIPEWDSLCDVSFD